MQPNITFIYDRRNIASPSRKSSVEMRITYNYKQRYISTGVMLYPHQWRDGKIVDCPDILQVSRILDRLQADVRQVILDMSLQGGINITQIPGRLKSLYAGRSTFLDFCARRSLVRKYGKSKDSRERYDRFLRLFTQWGRIQTFDDLTEHNVMLYDEYLSGQGMKPYSKWNNYHRFLNSFILDAIDEGLVRRNPYKRVSIRKDKSPRSLWKHLSPDELRRLRESPMPTGSLERVRDLFVFQTYTCLSYSDLRSFSVGSVREVRGMAVYTGRRHKTGKQFTVPLLPAAVSILDKYAGNLPVISNVKYNEYLKVVAQAAGIDKPVSSHWARHTGATLLLNGGVPMHIVSKICGHSSIRTTEQIYARLLDDTVVDAVKEIQDSLE